MWTSQSAASRSSSSFASGFPPSPPEGDALSIAQLQLIALATGSATIVLALLTRYGDLQRFDDAIEAWAGARRAQTHNVASVASLLGEKFVHPVLAGLAALTLYMKFGMPWDRFVLPMAAASLGGITAHHLVKFIYRRARPQSALDRLKTEPAFPSGHTTNSTAVLSTAAFLFTHMGLVAPPLAATIVIAAVTCTGLSRVALGWHWSSDVVGGWLTGVCVASLASAFYLTLSS